MFHDPLVAGRLWLAYSHLDPGVLPSPDGGTFVEGIVSTHLAVSADQGATWTFVSDLWPAYEIADPYDAGSQTYVNSEVASLAAVADGGQVTWYGSHLRYMQKPLAGYNPDFTRTWVIRVTASESPTPEALADAGESVLAKASVDAATWGVTNVFEDISPAGAVTDCYFMNNPALTYLNGKLYLAVECWVPAGSGNLQDTLKARVLLYSTTPSGPPAGWVWQWVGVLADHTMAAALGGETLDEPDFSFAADGALLAMFSPTVTGGPTGTDNVGCVALAMTSLDPPVFATACDGGYDIRGAMMDAGACTHDAASIQGIIGVERLGTGTNLQLGYSGVTP